MVCLIKSKFACVYKKQTHYILMVLIICISNMLRVTESEVYKTCWFVLSSKRKNCGVYYVSECNKIPQLWLVPWETFSLMLPMKILIPMRNSKGGNEVFLEKMHGQFCIVSMVEKLELFYAQL